MAGVLLGLIATGATARKDFHAEMYRVDLRVQPDGAVDVREEIRVRYEGGPFTFFYRGIPTVRVDGIDGLRTIDSTKVRARKDRVDVTWTFPPCRDTVRTFVLEYRARGALYGEKDQRRLRWAAFPTVRAYRIDAASASLRFPPGTPPPVSFATEPETHGFREVPPWSTVPVLELAAMPLRANGTVVLDITFPPGALPGPEPAWHQRQLLWSERLPACIAFAAVLVALGLFWLLRARSGFLAGLMPGTAEARVGGPTVPVSQPPEEISPALSGALVAGQPVVLHAFAVIFDLARRGIIRLDPEKPHTRWSSPRPRILRGLPSSNLEPWEQVVYDALFARSGTDGSVAWQRAVSVVTRRFPAFSREVQQGLIRRGEYDPAAVEARRIMTRRLVLFIVPDLAAMAAGILLLDTLGPGAFLPLGALAIVMGSAAVIARTFPLRTRHGADLARSWKGFARGLKDASRGAAEIDARRFENWLPHAVALGVAASWARSARRRGLEPPVWFRSASGDLSGDMRALTALIAITASSGGVTGSPGAGAAGGGTSGSG